MHRFFCYLLISISSLLLFSCDRHFQKVEKEQISGVRSDESHHARSDLKMVAFIAIMLLYLAPLTWMVERLVTHKNKKIKDLHSANIDLEKQKDSLAEAIANEHTNNSKLNKELRKLKSDYRDLQTIKKSEEKTLRQILKRIDSYSSRLYLTPKASGEIDLRSENFLQEIDDMIDGYSKGFIDAVKLSFPKMKLQRLRLVRYLYAGFSTETMMYLFNYENRAKLDNGKWLLKRNILENTNWQNLDCNAMLSKLNYKI